MKNIRCAVKSCGASIKLDKIQIKGTGFHFFPRQPKLRNKWIESCGREFLNLDDSKFVRNIYMCKDHFRDEDYIQIDRVMKKNPLDWRLRINVVPTIFKHKELPPLENERSSSVNSNYKSIILDSEIGGIREDDELLSSENERSTYVDSNYKSISLEVEVQSNHEELCLKKQLTKKSVEETRDELIRTLHRQTVLLRSRNQTLFKEIQQLKKKDIGLSKIFSPNQIKLLERDTRGGGKQWSEDDLQRGNTLHALSPKTYRYLVKLGFPFPGPSTLRRHRARAGLIKPEKQRNHQLSKPFNIVIDNTQDIQSTYDIENEIADHPTDQYICEVDIDNTDDCLSSCETEYAFENHSIEPSNMDIENVEEYSLAREIKYEFENHFSKTCNNDIENTHDYSPAVEFQNQPTEPCTISIGNTDEYTSDIEYGFLEFEENI